MDEEVKREIILDHYQNPLHRHVVDDHSYISVNSRNASCIDNLDFYVKIEDDIIKDIAFNGEACAISISSTSKMIENLIGMKINDAKNYIDNFRKMINEEEYDKDLLKEANVYDNIYKQNSRKSCAYLPYRGIIEAIEKYESNK